MQTESTLSKKDNLLKVLRGGQPAWVPFSINFMQWFNHHKSFDSLPSELQGGDYIDAMKTLGEDIFSRNVDGGFREHDREAEWEVKENENDVGLQTRSILKTPYGDLTSKYQQQKDLSTGYMAEHLVKDWQKDGEAFLWFLQQHEFDWEDAAFLETKHRVGDDGLVMIPFSCSPLKFMHNHFGLEFTCIFAHTEPQAARRVCDLFFEKIIPAIKRIAEHPETDVVCLMDNVDTPFYPPAFCKEYWTPYVRQAAGILHAHGKYLFVHACGQLDRLRDEFAAAEIDGLEGISPPPLGDLPLPRALTISDRFIVNGGFSAHEQTQRSDKDVRLYYEDLFEAMQPLKRWIFAASCQTAINTPWERILMVRDIVRERGCSV